MDHPTTTSHLALRLTPNGHLVAESAADAPSIDDRTATAQYIPRCNQGSSMVDWQRTYGIARSLWICYRSPTQRRRMDRLYSGLARPDDLVFDIGSHVGSRIASFFASAAKSSPSNPKCRSPRCCGGCAGITPR